MNISVGSAAMTEASLIHRYRIALGIFIVGLVISGLTAFPLLAEVRCLAAWLGIPPEASAESLTGLNAWIAHVRDGLEETYTNYPFMAYGTDWLAFGHLVIAIFFVGPWLHPRRDHTWIFKSGLAACLLVVPLALICGPLRGIPLGWRLIDCSFGIVGFIPLFYAYRLSLRLHSLSAADRDERATEEQA